MKSKNVGIAKTLFCLDPLALRERKEGFSGRHNMLGRDAKWQQGRQFEALHAEFGFGRLGHAASAWRRPSAAAASSSSVAI